MAFEIVVSKVSISVVIVTWLKVNEIILVVHFLVQVVTKPMAMAIYIWIIVYAMTNRGIVSISEENVSDLLVFGISLMEISNVIVVNVKVFSMRGIGFWVMDSVKEDQAAPTVVNDDEVRDYI